MKKLIAIACSLVLALLIWVSAPLKDASALGGQVVTGNYPLQFVPAGPSGPCSPNSVQVTTTSGAMYTCQNGTWAQIGGGTPFSYPPSGVPTSTGSAWGTSIDPTTLATWPPTQCAPSNPTSCPNFIPVFNNTSNGTLAPAWATGAQAGIWIQNWVSGGNVNLLAGQGALGPVFPQIISIFDSGLATSNVARLNPAGFQLFSLGPIASTPVAFPNSNLSGATNDLNTALWCGQFSLNALPSGFPPGFPANMPPNVAANNLAVGVPMEVLCTGATAVSGNSTAAQIVFDPSANIMWERTLYGTTWNAWQQVVTVNTQTVTIAACTGTNGSGTANCPTNSAPATATATCDTADGIVCNSQRGIVTIVVPSTITVAGDLFQIAWATALSSKQVCTFSNQFSPIIAANISYMDIVNSSTTRAEFALVVTSNLAAGTYKMGYACGITNTQ